jgi:hypothetical protein
LRYKHDSGELLEAIGDDHLRRRSEMKLFRNTDGAFETFLQMIWNKKLPWYENLLIWAGGVLLFVSFYALIFLAMLIGE